MDGLNKQAFSAPLFNWLKPPLETGDRICWNHTVRQRIPIVHHSLGIKMTANLQSAPLDKQFVSMATELKSRLWCLEEQGWMNILSSSDYFKSLYEIWSPLLLLSSVVRPKCLSLSEYGKLTGGVDQFCCCSLNVFSRIWIYLFQCGDHAWILYSTDKINAL